MDSNGSELSTVDPLSKEELLLRLYPPFVYIRGFGASVIAALGTTINIFAIIIIVQHGVNTPQNRLIINLALNNILSSAVSLPFMAFAHFAYDRVPSGQTCVIMAYINHIVQGMAVLSLFLISLNRFFVVLCPKDNRLTFGGKIRTCLILCACWFIVFILLFPPAIGLWAQYGLDPVFGVCTTIRSVTPSSKTYSLSITMLAFVFPLTGMICFYARILWSVRKHGRRIHNASLVKNHKKRELTITWLSLRLVLAFIALNLPWTLTVIFKQLESVAVFQALATVVMWSHACINPVLYISGDSRLRNAFLARCKGASSKSTAVDVSTIS